MCGIIGIISKDEKLTYNIARSLLNESQIRGKHATGVSFINKEDGLVTIKENIPAKDFIFSKECGNILIGHTRYSTSNIEYNQPLQENNISIVHNGVITQAPFEQWEKLFNLKNFQTKNDSEILLKYLVENKHLNFDNSSIAIGFIKNNNLYCFRNNQRPLYIFKGKDFTGFASTENIIKRAIKNKKYEIIKCIPNILYTLGSNFITKEKLNIHSICEKELQFNTIRGWKYLKGESISC